MLPTNTHLVNRKWDIRGYPNKMAIKIKHTKWTDYKLPLKINLRKNYKKLNLLKREPPPKVQSLQGLSHPHK